MSHTDAWKQAFNDSAGALLPQYKQQCNHVEVLNDIALSLNMNEKKKGAIKTWVHVPHTDLGWRNVSVKDSEWTLLMQITEDNFNDMDRTMIQHVIDARPGKKR